MTAEKRDIGKSVDHLLLRLPKPSPEQVHSSQERVGRVLRLQKDDLSADEPGDGDPVGVAPTGRRWFAFAAASVLIIAVIGSAVFIRNVVRKATSSNDIAQVVDGTLYRNRDSKSGMVVSGQRVAPGELFQSGEQAGTVIALADGSHVEMRSASEISLDHAADGVRIHLSRGSVIVTATEQHNGHLYVQTKDVTVTVVGTVFLVNAEESGSRVAVIQGEVQVTQGPILKKLLPGQQVTTAPSMQWTPVADEISWSRNKVTHVALLQSDPKTSDKSAGGLTFEVATIKPSNPQTRLQGGTCHGTDSKYSGALPIAPPPLGRCVYRGMTLKALIQQAYDLRGPNADDMVAGGPNWASSETFDVEAKSENPTTEATLRLMLKALIEDRFKLRLHRETKELPGFALVVSKSGSKLIEARGDEEKQGISRIDRGRPWSGRNVPMKWLAAFLSSNLARPVADETGLTGTYNFTLTFTPGDNQGLEAMIARLPPEVQAQIPGRPDPNGPSIFTAVQEQLGLKLEARKVPSDIYVIDAAQPPTEN